MDHFTFGVEWRDGDGDLLSRHGREIRRTYGPGDSRQTDGEEWIHSALTTFGPYTEVMK